MSNDNQLEGRINTMRQWIQRREARGKPWNADQLWARIRENWPSMSESDHEAIFQGAGR